MIRIDRDILGKHDQLVMDFIAAEFGGLLPPSETNPTGEVQVLWAAPKKYFVDYVTRKVVNNRPSVPRIAVQRMGSTVRTDMHIFNRLRKLTRNPLGNWIQSNPPTPVELAYQIDFWTENQWEMNYWERHLHLLLWGPGLNHYEQVTVGGPWGDKWVRFTSESFDDNTDIEPQTANDRVVRKTLTLKLATYTYPELDTQPFGLHDRQFVHTVPEVRRIEVTVHDFEGLELLASRYVFAP